MSEKSEPAPSSHLTKSTESRIESHSSSISVSPLKLKDPKALTTPKDSKPTTTGAAMRTSKRQPSKLNSGINGGRWTQKEHEDFLVGLELYGREWKKVASHICTRTSAQIRSHAQKYFAKINKDVGSIRKSSESFGFSDGDESIKSTQDERGSVRLFSSRGSGHRLEKSRGEARQVESLPSPDAMIASLSPKTRKKVSNLEEDEVCAVHVLASYAAREERHINYSSDHYLDIQEPAGLTVPHTKKIKINT